MTREQAAKILDDAWRGIPNNGDINLAYKMAIDTLRGPQPDPDTGLVPCGCGGKAEEGGLLFDTGDYFTSCRECGTLSWCMTQKGANKAWNTAMGYTAPPLPEVEG